MSYNRFQQLKARTYTDILTAGFQLILEKGYDNVTVADIARLAPFGNGNPPLTLASKNVILKNRRTMGSRGDHISLNLEDESGNEQRLVWWFGDVNEIPFSFHGLLTYNIANAMAAMAAVEGMRPKIAVPFETVKSVAKGQAVVF